MLEYTQAGRVAVWTLCRPPVNAINDAWLEEFHRALDAVESKGGVSVLHIRSAQKSFCAGADLKLMQAGLDRENGAAELVAMVGRMQRLYQRIENLEQVSLVELGGAAMGGGLELALACDYRIAASEAKLGLTEITLGLVPGAGGTQRLSKLCGPAIARRLILRGEVISGATAEALGVVQEAVPRAQLARRVSHLVDGFASIPGHALAECKRCLLDYELKGRDGFERELSATRRLYENPQTRERVGAFLAGRQK